MWPFRKRVDQSHLELVDQIHGLSQRCKHLEDSLAALEDRHERLRGKFYARNGGEVKGIKSKEQILAEWKAKQGG